MSYPTSITWLKASSILIIAVGILFSWTTTGPLSGLNVYFFDLVIWPLDGAQSHDLVETRLGAAIAGGLTAGFGIAIWFLTTEVYAHNQSRGRRAILGTVFMWFCVDGIGSVLAGAPVNAIANFSFLAMVALPVLLATNEKQTVPA